VVGETDKALGQGTDDIGSGTASVAISATGSCGWIDRNLMFACAPGDARHDNGTDTHGSADHLTIPASTVAFDTDLSHPKRFTDGLCVRGR
jgi:hypothetical protein